MPPERAAQRYRRPIGSISITLKRLPNMGVCYAGMALAKTTTRVLYSAWVSGRPS